MTARQRGEQMFTEVMTVPPPSDDSPATAGLLEFVFADVWSRPALSRRDRRFVTLACVAAADNESALREHVHAALASGDISVTELREAVLHFAVYAGWPKGSRFNAVVEEHSGGRQPPPATPVMSAEESFRTFNCVPFVPERDTPYTAAVLDYIYGQIWLRPGLGVKQRRLLTVACAGFQDAEVPLDTHVYAALKSRDITFEEMDELALHFAVYYGWPKGARLNGVIGEQKRRVLQEWRTGG